MGDTLQSYKREMQVDSAFSFQKSLAYLCQNPDVSWSPPAPRRSKLFGSDPRSVPTISPMASSRLLLVPCARTLTAPLPPDSYIAHAARACPTQKVSCPPEVRSPGHFVCLATLIEDSGIIKRAQHFTGPSPLILSCPSPTHSPNKANTSVLISALKSV